MSSEKKVPKGRNKGKKQGPEGQNFWIQLLITIVIFSALLSGYAFISGQFEKDEEVPLSQIAADITSTTATSTIVSIVVSGETIEATYSDETVKKSRKESESSLLESLSIYGLTANQLASVKIEIKEPGGVRFWFFQLAPLFVPLLLLLAIIWYISRQVKGAGMQAFTFGQSKARMVNPGDKNQKVTFADVAGAKEAKEELTEIVDFLKSPKKFIDIGARIPKGVMLMGGPGTGKCVTGDTRILTNKGLMRIDEVPQYFSVDAKKNTVEGLEIVSLEPNTLEFSQTRASHWYELGKQETIHVTNDAGLEIEGTHEHPVVVVDQATGDFLFKRLDEIKSGDYLVTATNTNTFGSYTKIPNADVAYFLGAIIGDGNMTTRGRVTITTADEEVIERLQRTALNWLGCEFKQSASRKYDYTICSIEAKKKIVDMGVQETYAEYKSVPQWLHTAPQEYVVAFLRGLFDTDGHAGKRGEIDFSSSSEELVRDVQLLLLNLGIVSRSYLRKKLYNGKLQYYITIYGDFVTRFQELIGFGIKRKANSLAKSCARQRNTNINFIPNQHGRIATVWNKAFADKTFDRAFYAQSVYKNVRRYIRQDRSPSLHGLETFVSSVIDVEPSIARTPEMAYLKRLTSGEFFFSKVKKISKGSGVVYDLTVPHTHNFVANGMINHNTLLARAVAGEAGVPFFSISGSEFVEMFVGVGASRVRDLFKEAKKSSPAIIFVDEIDAVGRVRGTGVGGGNDEREQTLNQILVELDGFEPNEKIIVMAATNRPDVLDPALLRPGRFDRRVMIDPPDRKDREQILIIHARKKPLHSDVNLEVIAERTPGFSGADLANLMNEAAILAAREVRKEVTQYDLIRSIEKVMLGPERKSHILNRKEKEITAYHEAGHALIASVLPYADPVHKVSIISRGRAAGYTLKLPFEDRRMQSKNEFMDDIAVTLGGYIAEKMIYGDLTTGASNDLQVLTNLARNMVAKWGMSERIGPIALETSGGKPMFGGGVEGKEHSEKVTAEVDAEVRKIIDSAYKKAEKVLKKHRKVLDAIAEKLMEVETLEREEFEKILIANGITPKKKQDIEHSE